VGTAANDRPPVGELLRQWRTRRRLSQLDLAIQADISSRHLSFVETGRSRPSREMVLHLAEELALPLRERNALLLAAGYAPVYGESTVESPVMAEVRAAVRQLLRGHEPYPAVVVDGGWDLVDANGAAGALMAGCAPWLLEPPLNVLRVSLHPEGMAPRIVNLGEWRAHLLARLRRQVDATASPRLAALHEELRGYPGGAADAEVEPRRPGEGLRSHDVVLPMRLRHGGGELAFFSTVATFGTPLDITVAELVIESFFPADVATAAMVRDLSAAARD
jgi:transcriptional regulator with XRE-family HTH domain